MQWPAGQQFHEQLAPDPLLGLDARIAHEDEQAHDLGRALKHADVRRFRGGVARQGQEAEGTAARPDGHHAEGSTALIPRGGAPPGPSGFLAQVPGQVLVGVLVPPPRTAMTLSSRS